VNLFMRQSGKSKLQAALDKDQAESGGVALEEAPLEAPQVKEEGIKPLFKSSQKSSDSFEVDLWGGWIKP
jgi:hypothetical protein